MAYDLTQDDLSMGASGIQPVYLQVYNQDLIQIFPTQYSSNRPVALLGSPSELGQQQYDHKVLKPRKISFTGILKKAHFQRVKTLLDKSIESYNPNDGLFCTFYTKTGKVVRMMIEQFEETGNNQRLDAVEVKVALSEFLDYAKKKK